MGYVEATASIKVAIVYIISLAFFGSRVDLLPLFALAGTTIGIILVANSGSAGIERSVSKSWFWWSLGSGIMFAVLAITNKFVLTEGLKPSVALACLGGVTTILYGISAPLSGKSMKLSTDLAILLLHRKLNILEFIVA